MHKWRGRGVFLGLVSLALIAAACGSSSKKSTSGSTSSTPSGAVKQGGNLVFGAEQEPDTMDWISSNAGAAWGVYTVETNTMPRAMDYTDDKGYVPSILLTGAPDLKTSPNQVVTYHINPKAVWSDGQPITSTDFKYTWDQIAHGTNIYDSTGYVNISSVDDSDPHTAVVTFQKPYAGWKTLFTGNYGIFPSHILQGKDRDAAMNSGYTWSGGPWMMDHWTKGVEIKLVPNPEYWGQKPNLSSVTFKFITDTAAEFEAFRSDEIQASYPQAQPGTDALKGTPGTYFDAISGLSFEALWYNTSKAPLTDPAVRQALAYATDRNAIVQRLFAPIQPDIKPINSFATPAFGTEYTQPFSKYHQDQAMVNSLMTGAGYTKGANGLWTKNGQPVTLELKTTTGNHRRQLTAQVLQNEWQQAGFQLMITQEKASVLFGQDGPSGNFQVALYAQTPTDNDPSSIGCPLWCTKNIPSAANGNTGTNWYRISSPTLDTPLSDVDTNLNQGTRTSDFAQGQSALAQLVPGVPIDPFPDIVIVNTDRVGVQGGTFKHNFAYGPFVYMNTWYAK